MTFESVDVHDGKRNFQTAFTFPYLVHSKSFQLEILSTDVGKTLSLSEFENNTVKEYITYLFDNSITSNIKREINGKANEARVIL